LNAAPAEQWFDARGAQQRVVDVVLIGRGEMAIPGVPRLLVGVVEDDELEFGASEARPTPLGEPPIWF